MLVLGSENQNKGNQTPYEYFNGKDNSRKWQEFKARVETSRFPRSKKQRILLQKFDEDGFKERNLNDTRYVNRFLCQFIAERMRLTGKGEKTCLCIQWTNYQSVARLLGIAQSACGKRPPSRLGRRRRCLLNRCHAAENYPFVRL